MIKNYATVYFGHVIGKFTDSNTGDQNGMLFVRYILITFWY